MRIVKLHFLWVIPVLSVLFYAGCGGVSNPVDPGIVPDGTKVLVANSLGETLSRFTFNNGAVTAQNDLKPTGQAPNQLLIRDGVGYCVNSLSNSILVFDVNTLSVLFEASVGTGKSPFNMDFISGDEILVTNFKSDDCVRMNISSSFSGSNRVVATIPLPSGSDLPRDNGVTETKASPESVVVVGNKAYVSIANLDSTTFMAGGPGLVAIIDLGLNQVQTTFETQGRNTLGLCRDPYNTERLYIISAGNMNPTTYVYDGDGVIDVFNLDSPGILSSINVPGAPFEMIIAPNRIGYMTDGKEGKILTLNTTTLSMGDSITIAQSGGLSYASGIAFGPNNMLFVLEFNHDELIVIDTYSNNEVVDRFTTGDGPDALAVIWE